MMIVIHTVYNDLTIGLGIKCVVLLLLFLEKENKLSFIMR